MFLMPVTVSEVCKWALPIYCELLKSWNDFNAANSHKINSSLKSSRTGALAPRFATTTTVDGIQVSLVPIGICRRHISPGTYEYYSNTYWLHFQLTNPDTGAPCEFLVRPEQGYVLMLEAHAVARYRERRHPLSNFTFDETVSRLVRANALFLHVLTTDLYGTSCDKFLESLRCLDGVFLGYYDQKLKIHVLTTFLLPSQLLPKQSYHFTTSPLIQEFFLNDYALKFMPLSQDRNRIYYYFLKDQELIPFDSDCLETLYPTTPRIKAYRALLKQRWLKKILKKGYR